MHDLAILSGLTQAHDAPESEVLWFFWAVFIAPYSQIGLNK
jgi:hypothetical protein